MPKINKRGTPRFPPPPPPHLVGPQDFWNIYMFYEFQRKRDESFSLIEMILLYYSV